MRAARRRPDLPRGEHFGTPTSGSDAGAPGVRPDSNGAVTPEFSDALHRHSALSGLEGNGTPASSGAQDVSRTCRRSVIPVTGRWSPTYESIRVMSRRLSLGLLALAVVVGLAALVLALMNPSMVSAWLTAFAMACVAGVQVLNLRKSPPGHH